MLSLIVIVLGECDQSAPTGTCSSFTFLTNVVYADSGPMLYEVASDGKQTVCLYLLLNRFC